MRYIIDILSITSIIVCIFVLVNFAHRKYKSDIRLHPAIASTFLGIFILSSACSIIVCVPQYHQQITRRDTWTRTVATVIARHTTGGGTKSGGSYYVDYEFEPNTNSNGQPLLYRWKDSVTPDQYEKLSDGSSVSIFYNPIDPSQSGLLINGDKTNSAFLASDVIAQALIQFMIAALCALCAYLCQIIFDNLFGNQPKDSISAL